MSSLIEHTQFGQTGPQRTSHRSSRGGDYIWRTQYPSSESEHPSKTFVLLIVYDSNMSKDSNRDYSERPPRYPITADTTKAQIDGYKTALRLELSESKWQGSGGSTASGYPIGLHHNGIDTA